VAAFATPAELASWLQVPSVDTATATLVLNIASTAIRSHCDWNISQETDVVATLNGSAKDSLWLKSLFVTGIGSVVEDGVTLTVLTQFNWTSQGQLLRLGRCWTWKPRAVVVTFTHGYATVPDDVKGACLQMAGRAYQNPGSGLRSHGVDDFTETFAVDVNAAGVVTDADATLLKSYARPAIV